MWTELQPTKARKEERLNAKNLNNLLQTSCLKIKLIIRATHLSEKHLPHPNYTHKRKKKGRSRISSSHLVGINTPVGNKLWKHCSKKSKQSTRRTHRDIVLNEKGRENAPTKSRHQVDYSNTHCRLYPQNKRKMLGYIKS